MLQRYLKKIILEKDLPLSRISCVGRAGADDLDTIYLISLQPSQKVFQAFSCRQKSNCACMLTINRKGHKEMGKEPRKPLLWLFAGFFEDNKHKQLVLLFLFDVAIINYQWWHLISWTASLNYRITSFSYQDKLRKILHTDITTFQKKKHKTKPNNK